ncbi:MAG TPA: sugar phosphate nucleotidyltransferase [Candidatus Deferrimicrobium sp.]|nr:sugar phosphate nucleotidyltransferase [Candidatus Deferrimicrobium sp.]
MKVIIPVAGSGTRLRPHTLAFPKALLHVAGKPVLAHVLEPVAQLKPDEVIFVVGFKGELISQYVAQHYSFKATFVQQEKLLGLGYALYLALQKAAAGPALVLLGDTIVECDLERFTRAGDFVLGLHTVKEPQHFGIAEVSAGKVVDVEEKPANSRSNLALIGLYYFRNLQVLKTELERQMQSGKLTYGEIQLTDALHGMIHAGNGFIPYEVSEWHDCGNKETLLRTNRYLLQKLPSPRAVKGSLLVPPVYISHTARIVNSIVGPNVTVSDDAVIENAVVTDSIVWPGARVGRVVLENSLVGYEAEVLSQAASVNVGEASQTRIC